MFAVSEMSECPIRSHDVFRRVTLDQSVLHGFDKNEIYGLLYIIDIRCEFTGHLIEHVLTV